MPVAGISLDVDLPDGRGYARNGHRPRRASYAGMRGRAHARITVVAGNHGPSGDQCRPRRTPGRGQSLDTVDLLR